MIARTEMITAVNEGLQQSWQEAQDQGMLPKSAVKVWLTTPDDRQCPICEELDGQEQPLDGMFEVPGTGEFVSGPTAHPQCRCALAIDFK